MEDVREDRLDLIRQDPIPPAVPTLAADRLQPAPLGMAAARRHPWAADFELPEVLRSGRMPGRWGEGED
jgi:hypothetical protein